MPLQEFLKMQPDIRFLANILEIHLPFNTHTPWIVCSPELLNTIFSGGVCRQSNLPAPL